MLFLLLSIGLSVLLLLNFRLFPRYNLNTFQAIVFNYPVCFLTGYLLLPADQSFHIDFAQTWTWLALGLGVGFIVTFLLSGASTQRMGITATSLANNLSLVIPVCFSLFVFNAASTKAGSGFDAFNYLGLVLAVVAVGLSTYKEESKSDKETNPMNTPKSRRMGLQVLLPVAVFLCYGATNTMINYMNLRYIPSTDKTIQVTLTMVIGAVVAGLLMLTVRLVQGKETIHPRSLIGAVTLGVPNFLSFYTLLLALSAFNGNGAFVYPTYNIGVILLAALVAALFFRERLSVANKVGLALAVLAIGLISWQELAA
ncbi:EamA/RhaT family transporter [Spirosoma utsteinense]|uniref:Drug/metabolite transporter (DMT)-like permease n=1 Tax=Spirosoma utsteinense TaxID=2585773 RepID=A0ABR6VZE9_9BACT|nr:EamA/RhaT family transporter [Spirosoma utsteinense]MBC3784545.1 drug/metabolite transporter (DMT)-like permease [Spirosoma utsteinense]MBC3789704.1 drug/metabolite transporter (DMT)-like permease [Spirosoma utsteinense]